MHLFSVSTVFSKALLPPTFKIVAFGLSGALLLTGCQATKNVFNKIDDGSLAYQQTSQLEPLQLPVSQQTQPFVPLYPLPAAVPNTLDLESDSGKRFELPPPYRPTISE